MAVTWWTPSRRIRPPTGEGQAFRRSAIGSGASRGRQPPRTARAAQVGEVLAQREAAVHVQRVDDGVLAELGAHLVRLRLVALDIARGPPVAQVAPGVELPAAVVEAVTHLVADHCADRAVVRGVV